ncbi:MAG: LPS export ABC transporter ATP-binding protein [Henriciella sp.]|nr:LPS export ABC transporter ATP-binding protein [Henriciella sp.]
MDQIGQGLVVQGLAKTFGKRQVVQDVSLSLQRGEIVGLLGPNGAGKTTCFYMIMGLISADTGVITIDGADVTGLPMYQRARLGLGYLPQEASIFRGMTVEDNIMAVVELVERNKAERSQPSTSLSGGGRRRVEIARALASKPSFMLLDEPFTGIDPLAISDISDLVGYLKDRGLGVLITDHQVRETLEIVDRASIIYEGGVLFEGAPKEVLANEDVRRVYLGQRFAA